MGRITEAVAAICAIPGKLDGIVLSLERASQIVQEARTDHDATATLAERTEALERAHTRLLGEVEVMVDRAESKLAAARGAEERARGMERRAEEHRRAVEGDEEGAEPIDAIRAYAAPGDDQGGAEEGVPDVRRDLDLPGNGREAGKAAARAFKWGI